MARPRKDGKRSATAARVGKPRPTGTGGTWQVRAYKPTPGAPHGRVSYRHPETGKQTSAVPTTDETIDDVFDYIEKSLDQGIALGTHAAPAAGASEPTRRDLKALGELYLEWLEMLNRSTDYISNRRSLLTKWIYPTAGDVLVRDWSTAHSETILSNARSAGLGACRVEDLGSTLSGMRRTAQARRWSLAVQGRGSPGRSLLRALCSDPGSPPNLRPSCKAALYRSRALSDQLRQGARRVGLDARHHLLRRLQRTSPERTAGPTSHRR
jgi:hypothetical protein